MSNRSGYEITKKILIPASIKYGPERERLREIIRDKTLPLQVRFQARLDIQKLPRRSCVSRQRNRCSLTHRTRAFNRSTGLNSFVMRMLISKAQLPGYTKASW